MAEAREFDMIIYGATGFTGRLVAEYMAGTHPQRAGKWAMAGRSAEKLAAVRDEMGLPGDTPMVVANADDPESLKAMAERAKVICTTVGPYTLYGEPLVAACVEAGTDYVDLSGEPLFMRDMIEKYDTRAKETGARIVHSCGFDSIPFDLGVAFVQEAAKDKFGAPAPHVRGRVRKMQGTFSGGTAASGRATMAAVQKNPALLAQLTSPFCLTPGFTGADQPQMSKPVQDPDGMWAAPFFMAVINTKNVHRSNVLNGLPYGEGFQYDEMIATGPGEAGEAAAKAVVSAPDPMASDGGPKPGEGPSKAEREAGHYDVLFTADMGDGRAVKAGVTGDKDPGYGSTSKILAESALFLADGHATVGGGVFTPGAAFGTALVPALVERAGMTFTVEA